METLLFWLLAVVALIAAGSMIIQRNPVHSALFLIITLFSLAGLFLLLSAPFLAVIQIIVYAGAIMVLFLFVIMLLNLGDAQSDMRGTSTVAATLVIVGLLAVELLALLHYSPRRLAGEFSQWPTYNDPATVFVAGQIAQQEAEARGVVGAVAVPLFQVYLIPFEITSILLLVAIVGAVVLAKRNV
jgi:NADH-quinone oxidoreductase subunit J